MRLTASERDALTTRLYVMWQMAQREADRVRAFLPLLAERPMTHPTDWFKWRRAVTQLRRTPVLWRRYCVVLVTLEGVLGRPCTVRERLDVARRIARGQTPTVADLRETR